MSCAGRAELSQPQIMLTFPLNLPPSNLHTTTVAQHIPHHDFILVPDLSQPLQTDHPL
jgi:hypothetical protein